MDIIIYFLIIIFGLIFGSFLTAFTYRIPKRISIAKGRSFCDNCKKKIKWYDNIPLFSYLCLKGKCRFCSKKISIRYPLIELLTALTFLLIFIAFNLTKGEAFLGSAFYFWNNTLGAITLPYFLFISVILIAIFIIDLEKQIIPDELVFILYLTVSLALILTHTENFYGLFFAGFSSSLLMLLIVFATKGRGMGLGDAKFVIPISMMLGLINSVMWLFLTFLTGAYVGIILILVKKAKLKAKISMGPFLIIAFYLTLFWGNVFIKNLGLY